MIVGLRHISAVARVVDMAFAYAVDVAMEHLVVLMAGDLFLGTSLEFHILCVFFQRYPLKFVSKPNSQSLPASTSLSISGSCSSCFFKKNMTCTMIPAHH